MTRGDRLLDPRWQAMVSAPIALLLVATGAISSTAAAADARQLAPVVGFLIAVLILAAACRRANLFDAVAARLAGRASSSQRGLLAVAFAVATGATVVLSLDTTVVMVTPVMVSAARQRSASPEPPAYACIHLANSASLLLPISNLTNLLAVTALGIGFGQYVALMALPWAIVVALEWLSFATFFRTELALPMVAVDALDHSPRVPRLAAGVVVVTLAGIVAASLTGVAVAWPAAAGAAVLVGAQLVKRHTDVVTVAESAQIPFAVFVLALGIIVRTIAIHGVGAAVARVMPGGDSLPALLATTGLAALLANLVNNLPATLVLLPIVAPSGVTAVLAMLIGVGVGPNLTYAGSLATLLWRRQVGSIASLRRFTLLGVRAVPAQLLVATVSLWAVSRV